MFGDPIINSIPFDASKITSIRISFWFSIDSLNFPIIPRNQLDLWIWLFFNCDVDNWREFSLLVVKLVWKWLVYRATRTIVSVWRKLRPFLTLWFELRPQIDQSKEADFRLGRRIMLGEYNLGNTLDVLIRQDCVLTISVAYSRARTWNYC